MKKTAIFLFTILCIITTSNAMEERKEYIDTSEAESYYYDPTLKMIYCLQNPNKNIALPYNSNCSIEELARIYNLPAKSIRQISTLEFAQILTRPHLPETLNENVQNNVL